MERKQQRKMQGTIREKLLQKQRQNLSQKESISARDKGQR